jgi:hypothetical protein
MWGDFEDAVRVRGVPACTIVDLRPDPGEVVVESIQFHCPEHLDILGLVRCDGFEDSAVRRPPTGLANSGGNLVVRHSSGCDDCSGPFDAGFRQTLHC